MRATYYDSSIDKTVDVNIDSIDDFMHLFDVVVELKTQRGISSIDLFRHEGDSLSFSSDGHRVFLMWIDSLGDSYHSVGGRFDNDLVFDYLGSWSEAPGEFLVPYVDAIEAVRAYLKSGSPVTQSVLFSPE